MTATSPRPLWMLLLFAVAAVIGLINLGIFLYGLTLPDDWSVDESIEIAAEPEEIYPLLASPRRWPEWTNWNKAQDPTLELAFHGPDSGTGASYSWIGEVLGRGKLTIRDAQPNRAVGYTLELQGEPFSENGRITLERTHDATRVRWQDGGELGGTLGRFFRERLEASVAADFAASLERLKNSVEQQDRATGDDPPTETGKP